MLGLHVAGGVHGQVDLDCCRCALWLHPPSKVFPGLSSYGSLILAVRLLCSTSKISRVPARCLHKWLVAMPLATLLPSAVWRGLVAAGSLLSQMPVLCHCLVAGLLAGQSVFGNFNFCVLHLLVRLACRKVSFLQDTCMANLSWFCRYSGPSHFTKT